MTDAACVIAARAKRTDNLYAIKPGAVPGFSFLALRHF
jgi:hypothetical protein